MSLIYVIGWNVEFDMNFLEIWKFKWIDSVILIWIYFNILFYVI